MQTSNLISRGRWHETCGESQHRDWGWAGLSTVEGLGSGRVKVRIRVRVTISTRVVSGQVNEVCSGERQNCAPVSTTMCDHVDKHPVCHDECLNDPTNKVSTVQQCWPSRSRSPAVLHPSCAVSLAPAPAICRYIRRNTRDRTAKTAPCCRGSHDPRFYGRPCMLSQNKDHLRWRCPGGLCMLPVVRPTADVAA